MQSGSKVHNSPPSSFEFGSQDVLQELVIPLPNVVSGEDWSPLMNVETEWWCAPIEKESGEMPDSSFD